MNKLHKLLKMSPELNFNKHFSHYKRQHLKKVPKGTNKNHIIFIYLFLFVTVFDCLIFDNPTNILFFVVKFDPFSYIVD